MYKKIRKHEDQSSNLRINLQMQSLSIISVRYYQNAHYNPEWLFG